MAQGATRLKHTYRNRSVWSSRCVCCPHIVFYSVCLFLQCCLLVVFLRCWFDSPCTFLPVSSCLASRFCCCCFVLFFVVVVGFVFLGVCLFALVVGGDFLVFVCYVLLLLFTSLHVSSCFFLARIFLFLSVLLHGLFLGLLFFYLHVSSCFLLSCVICAFLLSLHVYSRFLLSFVSGKPRPCTFLTIFRHRRLYYPCTFLTIFRHMWFYCPAHFFLPVSTSTSSTFNLNTCP